MNTLAAIWGAGSIGLFLGFLLAAMFTIAKSEDVQ